MQLLPILLMFPACRKRVWDFLHYQLTRNVLAARYHGASFFLICDDRRPDLQDAFAEVVGVIADPKFRDRCKLITWQRIVVTLPPNLQIFFL